MSVFCNTTSKKKVVIHLSVETTARQVRLNKRQVAWMIFIVSVCLAFVVASFISGVNYAYALEPDDLDTDLTDYYYRMEALRDLFRVFTAMGVISSLMVPFFLMGAYRTRIEVGPSRGHRENVVLTWLLLAASLHLLGSGIGYLVTVSPWLANR